MSWILYGREVDRAYSLLTEASTSVENTTLSVQYCQADYYAIKNAVKRNIRIDKVRTHFK